MKSYSVQRTAYSVIILFFMLSAFSFQLSAAHAANVSSKELIENAKELDGKRVTYKGEAVIAVMKRGENSWVNLNDGENAIGVWCESSQIKAVKFLGGYKFKGDTVEASGVFHRACPVHDGELDIHADTIKIVGPGHVIAEEIRWKRMKASLPMLIIALAIILLFRKRI